MSAVHAAPVPLASYVPEHFLLAVESGVATVTLNRPERKNPLTFDSYGELRDMFHALRHDEDVRVVVLTGAGGNFCSGGDVYEIIEPLTKRDMKGLLAFTRRALDEALGRVTTRRMFGGLQSDLQLTQAAIADMATEIDAMPPIPRTR